MKTEKPATQMREVEPFLAILYESYSIMNCICWQGSLPPCLLRMSHRLSSRVWAYARKGFGSDSHRIVFNTTLCYQLNDAGFLQIMAHEMIHIWQFSHGRRGGHGRDFQGEQHRLGLILGQVVPQDSPMGFVFFMHSLKNLHPADAARKIAAHPNHRRCETEYYQSVYK